MARNLVRSDFVESNRQPMVPAILAAAACAMTIATSSAASIVTSSLACTAALSAACQMQRHKSVFSCAECAGAHQRELMSAGCSNSDIAAWCAGVAPSIQPQFPGSKLIVSSDWAVVLNAWTGMDSLQQWVQCYSSFQNGSRPSAFQKGCGNYATTLIVARNGLNCTFGGYATRAWNKDACCRDPVNSCVPLSSHCYERNATSDFVYGLAPGNPVRYPANTSANHFILPTYQVVRDVSTLVLAIVLSGRMPRIAAFLDRASRLTADLPQ